MHHAFPGEGGLDALLPVEKRYAVVERARVCAERDFLAEHALHIGNQVLPGEDAVPLAVEGLALAVEHVVVVEQVLPGIEVRALDAPLRLLHGLVHDTRGNRHHIVDSQAGHQAAHRRSAKEPAQVVLQRKVELAAPGVALPGRAPSQLIVNPARLVPLGPDDVQPAEFHDARALRHVLPEPYHLLIFRPGKRSKALLHGKLSGFSDAPAAQQLVNVRQCLLRKFPAQLDIHATTGHVRRDGHRSKRAGASDDGRFARMLPRVEHLMPHAALEQ